MPGSATDRAAYGASLWRLLAPWAILPAALALIALIDWLKHGREQTRRKEAG